mmetsp:Transcript_269/g.413  ORF Transcript_269/g.413 Transcript_269/m.413 type:complete len:209 (-) Transcript_269:735-1361(-)
MSVIRGLWYHSFDFVTGTQLTPATIRLAVVISLIQLSGFGHSRKFGSAVIGFTRKEKSFCSGVIFVCSFASCRSTSVVVFVMERIALWRWAQKGFVHGQLWIRPPQKHLDEVCHPYYHTGLALGGTDKEVFGCGTGADNVQDRILDSEDHTQARSKDQDGTILPHALGRHHSGSQETASGQQTGKEAGREKSTPGTKSITAINQRQCG